MKIYKTNDIAMAAYLLTKGLKLYHVDIDQTGKYIFEFEDNQRYLYHLQKKVSCLPRKNTHNGFELDRIHIEYLKRFP